MISSGVSAVIDRLAKLACAEFDARYPAVDVVGKCPPTAAPEAVGHRLHVVDEHVGLEVIPGQQDDGAGNPGLDQGEELGLDGFNSFGEFVGNQQGIHPVVGTADGRGHPGSGQGKTDPDRGAR